MRKMSEYLTKIHSVKIMHIVMFITIFCFVITAVYSNSSDAASDGDATTESDGGFIVTGASAPSETDDGDEMTNDSGNSAVSDAMMYVLLIVLVIGIFCALCAFAIKR